MRPCSNLRLRTNPKAMCTDGQSHDHHNNEHAVVVQVAMSWKQDQHPPAKGNAGIPTLMHTTSHRGSTKMMTSTMCLNIARSMLAPE